MMTEVVATKRQGIVHLQDMLPVDFLSWMKSVKMESSGVLKDIKCVGKIDGMGARFGRDQDGNIFFEGSRTGPKFKAGEFMAHYTAKLYADDEDRNQQILKQAQYYEDLLEIVKNAKFMEAIPPNSKVVVEVFYNQMAFETDAGLKFVTITYDKTKLGTVMTILPYTVLDALTGEEHAKKEEILQQLYALSTSELMIVDPNHKFTGVDVSKWTDAADRYTDDHLNILQSRTVALRWIKQDLKAEVQKLKDDLAIYLLNHPTAIADKYKLGPEIEGVVLHLPTVKNGLVPFKITTPEFKNAHAAMKRT